jgi:tripartite-type tricarboxylate transporter receptor subunit TctC
LNTLASTAEVIGLFGWKYQLAVLVAVISRAKINYQREAKLSDVRIINRASERTQQSLPKDAARLGRIVSTLFAALLASALSLGAAAQDKWPSKPIRLFVQVPPGGAPDVIARIVGQKMAENTGQAVVVENRPGANGNIAAEAVAKSAPDGHTLLLGMDSSFVVNPHLYSTKQVELGKDLLPAASIANNVMMLAVSPKVTAKTLPEFVEYARKASPPLTYSSGGNGSQHHLTMERLKTIAGIDLMHIPYKGGAPAAMAAMTGEVDVTIAGGAGTALVTSGRLRALAVTGPKRMPQFPNLPTIGETYPGFELTQWYGLFAPVGTPGPVLASMRAELNKALKHPDVVEKLKGAAVIPWFTSPEEFSAYIKADYERYAKVVKQIGLKMD